MIESLEINTFMHLILIIIEMAMCYDKIGKNNTSRL